MSGEVSSKLFMWWCGKTLHAVPFLTFLDIILRTAAFPELQCVSQRLSYVK